MASVVSSAELKVLNKRLRSIRERVKNNPEEAIRILQSAGIVDKDGKLAAPYRDTEDK